jgi:hypothetical protein
VRGLEFRCIGGRYHGKILGRARRWADADPTAENTEGAIWGRIIRPAKDGLSAEAAQAFLRLGFDQADRQKMHELAEKVREGTLTPEEKEEVAAYERVGSVLSLLKAMAR